MILWGFMAEVWLGWVNVVCLEFVYEDAGVASYLADTRAWIPSRARCDSSDMLLNKPSDCTTNTVPLSDDFICII